MTRRLTLEGPTAAQPAAELVESLSDALAQMLVAEWKAKHSQGITAVMVNSPRGFNHADSTIIREVFDD